MERTYATRTSPVDGAETEDGAAALGTAAEPRPAGRRSWRRLSRQQLFEGNGWTAFRLGLDTLLLVLGTVAAIVGAPGSASELDGRILVWAFPPLVVVLLAIRGLYRDTIKQGLAGDLGHVVGATSLAAISLLAGAALLEPSAQPALLMARAWLFGTVYVLGGRVLLGFAQQNARRERLTSKPTLIVGAGQIGAHVERRLTSQPELGLLPVGYLDADPAPADLTPDRHAPVLGSPAELRRIVAETGAKHIVLGFSTAPDRELIPLVREAEALRLEISVVPRLFENVNVHVGLEHLGGLPLQGLRTIDPKGWHFTVKHVFDRVGAAVLSLLFAPLIAGLAIGVKLSSPGPVLFRQRRIGRDGREFEILKFRSMRAPEPGRRTAPSTPGEDIGPGGSEDADRITGFGQFLRQTSLDELPQLLNVLRGEMSLIGPRPERPDFAQQFSERIYRYAERTKVKSGMTGWAQVHGLRGNTSLRDRVEWDNYYIQNWSLWLDVVILFKTVAAIFRRAG